MNSELIKPKIKINDDYEIDNEFYRKWMHKNSDISKAIYHLKEAENYLLIFGEIEEKFGLDDHAANSLEVFCNQITHIRSKLTEYIDNNLDVLDKEYAVLNDND